MFSKSLKAVGKKGFKAIGKDEKGFTLIELLAVIVILGIIAVIAIPLIGGIINKSKTDSDLNTASQVYNAARLYVVGEANGDYTTHNSVTIAEMRTKGYLDADLRLPSTKTPIKEGTVTFNNNGQLTGNTAVSLTPSSTNEVGGAAGEPVTFTATEVLSVTKAAAK